MRRSASLLPSIRLSLAHGHLLCVVRLPRRGPADCGGVSEFALVASLTAPYLRWLTVFRGQRAPVLDDTPRAA